MRPKEYEIHAMWNDEGCFIELTKVFCTVEEAKAYAKSLRVVS